MASPPCVVALDQGTTGTRAIVYDHGFSPLGAAYLEHTQHTPAPGFVEHDPAEIWERARTVFQGALEEAGREATAVAAIGITNQTETLVAWDADSGEPLHHAIVWQSRQGAEACERLAGRADELQSRSGLMLDPMFSGPKLAWLLEHSPPVAAAAERGTLRLGNIDCWLAYRMTGGAAHVTDASNASRTMMFDLATGAFAPDLIELFGATPAMLPEIVPSIGVAATTDSAVMGAAIPVAAMAGDQQAALFGHGARQPGQAKGTYGTGAFVLACTGESPPQPAEGLLATVAWRRGDRTTFALDGSVLVAGDAVRWLRDQLGVITEAAEVEALAASVPDSAGVSFVPAFAGLGAPDWDPHARGLVAGLTAGAGRAHLARAALEAIAFQVADLLDSMSAAGVPLAEVRADGGASRNDLLMQLQADLGGVRVVRAGEAEMTARGVAQMAALGAGLVEDGDPRLEPPASERAFEPAIGEPERQARRARWRGAVELARRRLPELPG